jgi:hypothetical protein
MEETVEPATEAEHNGLQWVHPGGITPISQMPDAPVDLDAASESYADSVVADIPSLQSLLQYLGTETLQMTEEVWARRRQKRLEGVRVVKEKFAYRAIAFLRSQGEAVPSTPDGYDRQITKRQWEKVSAIWRNDLKDIVQQKRAMEARG